MSDKMAGITGDVRRSLLSFGDGHVVTSCVVVVGRRTALRHAVGTRVASKHRITLRCVNK